MSLPAIGFHYGVPFETYRSWDAVNCSTLKPMARSAAHCKWEMEHPKESDAMDVGSALHVSILEPARFDAEFYIGEQEYNATTKEGKEIRDREIAAANGRTYIRRKAGDAVDGDSVRGMSEAVWLNPDAKRLLELPGQCEVSALWKDQVTGLICKCRFDKLAKLPGGRDVIIELKTCRDAREWKFSKEAHERGYAAQAAYYIWAVKEITGNTPIHTFIAIENTPPYCSIRWLLDDAALSFGATQYRAWLNAYAECLKSNTWPGYPRPIDPLSLPKYATAD